MFDTADVAELLKAWTPFPLLSSTTPDTGTIHQTRLLKTARGDYALRIYRYIDREPIEREHALIAYMRKQDIPAVAPLPLPGGETLLERDGGFYALFPFAVGHQVSRHELTTKIAAAMGTFLSEVHRALRHYPQEYVRRRTLTVAPTDTLAKIERIEATIHSRSPLDEMDQHVIVRLIEKRQQLAHTSSHARDLSQLEHQVIHGDYQETNLFFEDGKVSAIIDWDQAYVAPRAWEVVRTLHLALKLDAQLCQAFLDAYRTGIPLPLTDLDLAATVYAEKRTHDLWAYEAIYLEGNDRVRQFLHPGNNPPPLAERWARLYDSLR